MDFVSNHSDLGKVFYASAVVHSFNFEALLASGRDALTRRTTSATSMNRLAQSFLKTAAPIGYLLCLAGWGWKLFRVAAIQTWWLLKGMVHADSGSHYIVY